MENQNKVGWPITVLLMLISFLAGGIVTYLMATTSLNGNSVVKEKPVEVGGQSSPVTDPAVQKINWNIEIVNPNAEGYERDAQEISVDVIFADNTTKRYKLGTAYGCTGSTLQSVENGKTVFGKINCYYALVGVGFIAYSQNGKFIVERGDESAKDGSVKTTILLEI